MLVFIDIFLLASHSSNFSIHLSTWDENVKKYFSGRFHEKVWKKQEGHWFKSYSGVEIGIYHSNYPYVAVKSWSEVPFM